LLPPLPCVGEGGWGGEGVKITDFGLAKRLADTLRTQTGVILGTPSYMAPEQARGQKNIGAAADIYGLGAILYECLTGRPPFKADTVFNTLHQVAEQEPVPPRRLQPGVPRDLDVICLKCLEKEPGRRYASATELADDLRRFLTGETIHARPSGVLERAAKAARRRPAVATLLAVSAVTLLALVAAWAWFTVRLDEQKRLAIEQRNNAVKQQRIAQEQSERARHLLALAANSVDKIAINVRAGKESERAEGNPGTVLFKLACFYATMSSTLAADKELFAEDRTRLTEQYAASAVRLLVCAETIGFFEPARMENRKALKANADLDVLRHRDDYKQLVARLRL
jgi:hypothetical protein